MRRRYWLPGGALIGVGLVLRLFFVYLHFAGMFLMGVGAVVLLFGLVDALLPRFVWLRVVRLVMRIGAGLVALAMLVTGIAVGVACGGSKNPEADYVVVLGAGVNGTAPSRSLRARLHAAQTYLETYPNAVAVLSGGQGKGESITEAECMYRWLTEHGVDPGRLWKEERATTTAENLRYSLDLIEERTGQRPEHIAIVSSAYHLLRARLLAKREGVTAVCCPANDMNTGYSVQMVVREIFGVWYTLLLGNL